MPRRSHPPSKNEVFTAEEIRDIYNLAEESLRRNLIVIDKINEGHGGITSDVHFALPAELANKTKVKQIDSDQLVLLKHSRFRMMRFPSKHWGRGQWWCNERETLGLVWNLKNETNISEQLAALQNLARTGDHKDLVPSLQFAVNLAAQDACHPLYALWFVMPIIKGPTVQSLIIKANEKGWKLPPWLVAAIFQQVIEAVMWAHTPTAHKGVMTSLDINPGNVMLELDSRPLSTSLVSRAKLANKLPGVRLIDFGNCQLLDSPSRRVLCDIKSHEDIFRRFKLYTQPGCETISLIDDQLRGDNGSLYALLDQLDRTKVDKDSDDGAARDRKRTKRALNEEEPGIYEVQAALDDNDLPLALTRSKKWCIRVQKDRVDDEEVEKWLDLCREAMMPRPSSEAIATAVHRHLDPKGVRKGGTLEEDFPKSWKWMGRLERSLARQAKGETSSAPSSPASTESDNPFYRAWGRLTRSQKEQQ